MLVPILSDEQRELLAAERELLAEVRAALERVEVAAEDRRALGDSVRQLDELFLIVVVGEFNAGKSAFVNALLGEPLLAEGVTPTTAKIHLLTWGEARSRQPVGDAGERITAPLEALRELSFVDTPGTNALDRVHEALTTDYVPRADLVLFVTSADRPLSESERQFLESIAGWGKKLVLLVNKVDILRGEAELDEVLDYVRANAGRILGLNLEVLPISALRAAEARARGDEAGLAASGLPAVERFLRDRLDQRERLRLKLGNPLGVASRLLDRALSATELRLGLLADDLRAVADIEGQTAAWAADVAREFELRLADIDNVLHRMERRGLDFFDDTVRIERLRRLFDREALQTTFDAAVVGAAPAEIEAKVAALIDWLVDSELGHWQSVVNHVNRRAAAHADRMVGEVGGRFQSDRARLLDTVGRAARSGLAAYDRAAEARRMAGDLQKAVTSAAALEVGAVGLGAAVALAASSTAADVTGFTAAGLLAVLGLFVLPHRRRRAKAAFSTTIASLRARLMEALRAHFATEAEQRRERLAATVAPYTRFVRAESERLTAERDTLSGLAARVDTMRARVGALA